LYGAAPGDPGLRSAATPADAPNDHGRRGSDLGFRDEAIINLFYAPHACSLVSHNTLEEAGAAYKAVRVDFAKSEQRQPEYLAINPKGRVRHW
jgi:Glutathione S-transferase, N-terminal domain